MPKYLLLLIAVAFFLTIDFYVFQAVKTVFQAKSETFRNIVYAVFWTLNGLTILAFLMAQMLDPEWLGKRLRWALGIGVFLVYFSKLFSVLFLIIDDLLRAIQWVYYRFVPPAPTPEAPENGEDTISRSEFLAKTGLTLSTLPMVGASFAIISGMHDYRIRKQTIHLPNLPKSFDGIRIAQLSDIHSGTFYNPKAVLGGVEMLLGEKPDLVFFTGDLVNDTAGEMKDYTSIFSKIKAPLGVYSVLGNHDYGDYVRWESIESKRQNLKNLIQLQRDMGWRLMLNEHQLIEQSGDKLAIIGIENWGTKFVKYGKLAQAKVGTQEAAVKLLLSHDPSHWDAEVRPQHPDIDIAFAGHTHGMQLGIEIGNFRWSPVQYVYEQWAGLYQKQHQYLYVNRGFGCLVFPGRLGILPEITIIELKRG
jgi:uncharacterized protein